MITRRLEYAKIEILPDGIIQVEEIDVFEDSGIELGRLLPHRRVIEPDSDTDTEDNPRLIAIIRAVHTPEVIEEYKRKKKAANETDTGITPRN